MKTRIIKGRQRVDMVKMKNVRNLQVTFSKRRASLFKKAGELCMLCGAEIVIVVYSPGDKGFFSFGHPSVNPLLERFLGRNLPQPNNDVHNQQIVNLEGILQMEKNRGESLREIRKRANGRLWQSPMEELHLFQLQHLKKALEILKQKVEKEAQMVNNNAFPFQTLGSAWTPSNCVRLTSSYGLNVGGPLLIGLVDLLLP
ncbi:agamous-like MADS-box protein AGL62 [Solanum stenotomum]|uniref:agamous-like MADS-box protein AGL62 n=1 Tax=Solanum stenotomum TaxID=172797 RepID=UPI0020CFF2E0|nr:agamous-like MADS-box protein AGL62 [Solanum stenotomum]